MFSWTVEGYSKDECGNTKSEFSTNKTETISFSLTWESILAQSEDSGFYLYTASLERNDYSNQ